MIADYLEKNKQKHNVRNYKIPKVYSKILYLNNYKKNRKKLSNQIDNSGL